MVEELDVVAGIIEMDGRILIARRPSDVHLGGFWEFPGGKIEDSESDTDALRREIKEELDIDVNVGKRLDKVDHRYSDRKVKLRFYLCDVYSDQQPRPVDCEELRWVPPSELQVFPFPPADAFVIEKIQRYHQARS